MSDMSQQGSWKPITADPPLVSDRQRREAVHMALEMARQGHLSLFFLEIEGVRTAATVCFDYNNIRSLYNSGHNTEYASLGTGFLLKALCLKSAICEGKNYYDLLRGSEPYKRHLGAKERDLYCLSLFR